ncbi:MAG: mannose-1-phosphate guanylyltransferase/mannose-6-phosphate isomerase [Acetobacterales bacterium]
MSSAPPRKVHPVILSGGSGTRLWPMSRAGYPKQFLALTGDRSQFQDTVRRVGGAHFAAPLVIANEEHRFIVAEQLRALGTKAERIVLEPLGRNTAPAAAVAAQLLVRDDPEALMLLLPSDHSIADVDAFLAGVDRAADAAAGGALVTFGIRADRPETGYGYIRRGDPLPGGDGCFSVAAFVEKPDVETAEGFVASGDYSWNSGMFLFPAALYLEELGAQHPKVLAKCREAIAAGTEDLDFFRLDRDALGAAESISIDYAVMEHTRRAAVVPVDIGWSDVGLWASLWEIGEHDGDGNVLNGDVLALDVRDSYVRGPGDRLIAVLGVKDMVIVVTDDVVLVADRRRTDEVRALVDRLKAAGRPEVARHRTDYRPWGSFTSIDAGRRFQVKRIVVKPGAALSLQKHHHRAEHWVVVAGTARVTRGEDEILLHENESTYIPIGEVHRLENPGKIDLHLIEVQSGSYLGEDDIVRLEDVYGRG